MLKLIAIALSAFVFSSLGLSQSSGTSFKEQTFNIKQNYKAPTRESLTMHRFGYENAPFKFFIQSGLHGNETTPVAFTKWLIQRLQNKQSLFFEEFNEDFVIDIVPVANPSGYAINSRYNGRGVNLNRNFGVLFGQSKEWMGKSAFSEYETQVIRKMLVDNKYTAAVDVHGYVNWIVTPSAPSAVFKKAVVERSMVNEYESWINLLKQSSKNLGSYIVKSSAELGDGGSFEDFAYWQGRALAYCLELRDYVRRSPTEEEFVKYERHLVEVFKASVSIRKASSDKISAETRMTLPFSIEISH
jgi:hypothetical protein